MFVSVDFLFLKQSAYLKADFFSLQVHLNIVSWLVMWTDPDGGTQNEDNGER